MYAHRHVMDIYVPIHTGGLLVLPLPVLFHLPFQFSPSLPTFLQCQSCSSFSISLVTGQKQLQ